MLGDLPLPDEIHLLSFSAEADFQHYRADPKLAQMANLRGASVKATIVLSGQDVEIF